MIKRSLKTYKQMNYNNIKHNHNIEYKYFIIILKTVNINDRINNEFNWKD